MEYLQTFFSWIWGHLKAILLLVIGLLPDSPFQLLENTDVEEYLGYLNWLIPLSQMVAILQLWITAIVIFYIFQAILRWTKAIN